MKIYLIHSTAYPNFGQELYEPLKKSKLSKEHQFIFPHENKAEAINSKVIISNCDLVLAEVSFPSTGMGIELGWADMFNRKIICFHKDNIIPNQAVKYITQHIVSYGDSESMIGEISLLLNGFETSLGGV
jgi:hypothetical protein